MKQSVDVVIIGGSYAGLAGALSLGRAIRQVVILDSGRPCNRQTPHSHNFLTQDGSTPAEIAERAKAQVLNYPTVRFQSETAVSVTGQDMNFTVTTDAGSVIQAKKLLFATGIRDLMPALPGFSESWGISVIHCPYCHGYEYRDQPTGILMNGETALEMGRLIRNWTPQLTVFTNGPSSIPDTSVLSSLGITIEETPLQEIVHENGYLQHLVLADGRKFPLNALYARSPFEQHCLLPRDLGCVHTEDGYIQVDALQKTSIAGVYAAGDATTMKRTVSVAVAAGTMAGVAISREFLP